MLHHTRTGSGPPLVLIHGLGATSFIWNPLRPLLERDRELIAVDMPGFGRSAMPTGEGALSPPAIAAAIAELCDWIGVERPAVAGNSLGGWVALEMARAGKASAVCGLCPAGLWKHPLGPRRYDTRRLAQALKPLVLAAARGDRARHAMTRSVFAHPERVPPEHGLRMIEEWISAPGYEPANEEMRRGRFEHPEEVTVPVTVGWGEEERLLRRPHINRMPPQTRFVTLAGCGHTPTWDDPEAVARLLLEASSREPTEASAGVGTA